MGKGSKIEWCDHTFNPWIGCEKVSAGCKFCYAERDMTRKPRWKNAWGPPASSTRVRTKTWKDPIRWNKQAEKDGTRPKVFCASLCDVFEENDEVVEWRLDLIELIVDCPNLTWLLLTKRPEYARFFWDRTGVVPSNIWMGTSIEDQDTANKRIPELLKIPAHVHFVSAEPLLDFVRLDCPTQEQYVDFSGPPPFSGVVEGIDWVIVGGESGKSARPFEIWNGISIVRQCSRSEITVFVKQIGSNPVLNGKPCKSAGKGNNPEEWPEELQVRQFPDGKPCWHTTR